MTRAERACQRIKDEYGVPMLAEKLGITRPAVYVWTKIPEARVAAVSKITRIPASEIRPDLFRRRTARS